MFKRVQRILAGNERGKRDFMGKNLFAQIVKRIFFPWDACEHSGTGYFCKVVNPDAVIKIWS